MAITGVSGDADQRGLSTPREASGEALLAANGGDQGRATIIARCALPLALFASCAAAALVAFSAARNIPQNSDTVQSLLAAQTILHGNLLLGGWHLARDNFFFTDTLPFAAVEGIFGRHPGALAAIPALVYALIVAACLAGSLRSWRWSRDNLISIAAITLLIGLPPFGLYLPLLVADTHGASILFSLAALILLDGIAKPGPLCHRPLRVFAFAILAVTAVASDPYAIVFAFGPALVVLGIEFLVVEDAARPLGLLALVALCAAIGLVIPAVVARLGGFVTEPTIEGAFVPPEHLGQTVTGFFFGFLYSSGADIFGKRALAIGTVANAARLLAWILGGIAVLRRIRLLGRTGTVGLLDRVLLASVAIVTLACVFSRMFDIAVQGSVWNGGPGTRYIAPVLVFAALLAARAMPDMISGLPARRFRLAATVCLAGAAGGLLVGHTRTAAELANSPPWTARNEFVAAGRWLAARHLTCGVGEYWTSSVFTALMQGKVTVRALVAPPGGRLVPFSWIADDNWYHGTSAPTFAIWRDDAPQGFNFNAQSIAATYGPPRRVEHVAGFNIAFLPPHLPQLGPTLSCPKRDRRR